MGPENRRIKWKKNGLSDLENNSVKKRKQMENGGENKVSSFRKTGIKSFLLLHPFPPPLPRPALTPRSDLARRGFGRKRRWRRSFFSSSSPSPLARSRAFEGEKKKRIDWPSERCRPPAPRLHRPGVSIGPQLRGGMIDSRVMQDGLELLCGYCCQEVGMSSRLPGKIALSSSIPSELP